MIIDFQDQFNHFVQNIFYLIHRPFSNSCNYFSSLDAPFTIYSLKQKYKDWEFKVEKKNKDLLPLQWQEGYRERGFTVISDINSGGDSHGRWEWAATNGWFVLMRGPRRARTIGGLRKVLAGGLACLVFIVPFRNDACKRYLQVSASAESESE